MLVYMVGVALTTVAQSASCYSDCHGNSLIICSSWSIISGMSNLLYVPEGDTCWLKQRVTWTHQPSRYVWLTAVPSDAFRQVLSLVFTDVSPADCSERATAPPREGRATSLPAAPSWPVTLAAFPWACVVRGSLRECCLFHFHFLFSYWEYHLLFSFQNFKSLFIDIFGSFYLIYLYFCIILHETPLLKANNYLTYTSIHMKYSCAVKFTHIVHLFLKHQFNVPQDIFSFN